MKEKRVPNCCTIIWSRLIKRTSWKKDSAVRFSLSVCISIHLFVRKLDYQSACPQTTNKGFIAALSRSSPLLSSYIKFIPLNPLQLVSGTFNIIPLHLQTSDISLIFFSRLCLQDGISVVRVIYKLTFTTVILLLRKQLPSQHFFLLCNHKKTNKHILSYLAAGILFSSYLHYIFHWNYGLSRHIYY